MMQSADEIARFFKYSPQRQLALERWIDLLMHGNKKLKEMSNKVD